MKTWAVMMTLSVPVPETGFFMDFSLSLRAAGAGTTVTGLETLEQQLSFMENMPIGYQLVLLDQALSDYQRVDEIHDEMVDVYLSGELSGLDRLSDEQFSQLEPGIRDYFLREGIAERNHRMIEKLLPVLQESRVFVAIGALHWQTAYWPRPGISSKHYPCHFHLLPHPQETAERNGRDCSKCRNYARRPAKNAIPRWAQLHRCNAAPKARPAATNC
jgi:hypothetical protein